MGSADRSASDDIWPTETAPVFRLREDGVELVQLRWGIPPARPKRGPIKSHRNVKIIGPDETLRDAATAMKKLDVGVLPVGEHDKLVGMITDRPSRSRPTLFAGRGSDGLAPRSRITPSIVDPVSAGEQRRRAREFADRVSRPSKARANAVAPFMAAFLVHPPGLQFWPLMEWTSRMTARSSASAQ